MSQPMKGRFLATCLGFVAWWLPMSVADGHFRGPELEQVPVERLVANLQRHVESKPTDAQAQYTLARVHAMAYALKQGTLQAEKESANPFFGFPPEADYPPRHVDPAGDDAVRQKAQQHLEKAIEHYRKAVEHQHDHQPAQLGLAWSLEQRGVDGWALDEYRKAMALAWRKERDREHIFGSSITEEVARYMLPLLESRKADAAEIKRIRGYLSAIGKKPRAVTPILIPLEAETSLGALIDPEASVAFDLDGSGRERRWAWPTSKAGWLVFDPAGGGTIQSGLQLIGGVTFWVFWSNGYQALAALDDDGDGELRGSELDGLAIWQDRNANGSSERGEVRPVMEWGIRALSCRHAMHASGVPYSPEGVILEDGSLRPSYDWIVRSATSPPDR